MTMAMQLKPYNGCQGPRMVCTTAEEVEQAKQAKRDNPNLTYDVIEWEVEVVGGGGHLTWGSWIWTGKQWG
jgi:hypothetical protein